VTTKTRKYEADKKGVFRVFVLSWLHLFKILKTRRSTLA